MSEGPIVPVLIFVIGLGMLITSFILSIRAYKDPVFKIRPLNCDMSIYVNEPTYRTGTWYMLYRWGACPLGARTLETQVTREYYSKHPTVTYRSTSIEYWYYRDCIYNSTQWTQIDDMNRALGFNSHLEADSWKWFDAWIISMTAIIVLFLVILPVIMAMCSPDPGTSVIVASFILFTFSVLWSTVILLVTDTHQTNPAAWSTWFFRSCEVHIERSTGYTFAIMCAVFSGVLFLFPTISLLVARTEYWKHLKSSSQDSGSHPYEKIRDEVFIDTDDSRLDQSESLLSDAPGDLYQAE
jgi:hypothetical protein